MNLGQLRSELRTRIGVPATDGLFTDPVMNALINSGNHWLETVTDWPWLEKVATFSTVNAQDKYTPPNDWLRTIRLQVSDYAPLIRLDIAELIAMTGSGRPTHYAMAGDQLQFRPVPDVTVRTVTHIYVAQEPELVSDSDTPLCPASYHRAIVAAAAYFAFRRSANIGEANAAEAEFNGWKQQMLARHSRQSSSEGGGLTPNPDVPAVSQGRAARNTGSASGN